VDAAAGIIATNAHVAGATVGGWEVLFFDGSTAPVGDGEERGGGRWWEVVEVEHSRPIPLQARSIWYSPQEVRERGRVGRG
jgi:hypothetical protein